MEFLKGKKTYIAALGLVAYAGISWALTTLAPDVAASAGIKVDIGNTVVLVLNALGLGGVRAAIAKSI